MEEYGRDKNFVLKKLNLQKNIRHQIIFLRLDFDIQERENIFLYSIYSLIKVHVF